MIENAQRERRWCQGNLQHGLVLFAKGLRGVSRLHLLLGICGYLAGTAVAGVLADVQLDPLVSKIHRPVEHHRPCLYAVSEPERHGACLFGLYHLHGRPVLLPKVLALIDLAFDWERRRAFGGLTRTTVGVVGETIFSTLTCAIADALAHAFRGHEPVWRQRGWSQQKRGSDGTTWRFAIRRHWGHTLIGLVWGAFMWQLNQYLFWWFTPVLTGMVFSIPLSVWTSRRSLGARAKARDFSDAGRDQTAGRNSSPCAHN
jgi:membrane glycosyltransferase